ncbi:hypothetical protein Kpol_520p8 [Vanderwaltozyma polyspora DSM 70294]|uniref:Sulfhydryl oxidase n=1 Tax=Vanderwaltozyma polyspora (strain ATCC 22028 / DSM 70294 / BCRC 21397 / CBS 2163 / NBRC 10782 / NRRL Y-8283 / UCD 57-17) TaxID=436907 RepID=A7TM93_VANPO|nr:uncharacterized protein Kpol_520p8 [Vanderwaltozyma polyspora DSM 70294]EDO16587.1 hypothetical protein Kpol_520p8 [Vanderwaltozyma polyspora DSM 70294]
MKLKISRRVAILLRIVIILLLISIWIFFSSPELSYVKNVDPAVVVTSNENEKLGEDVGKQVVVTEETGPEVIGNQGKKISEDKKIDGIIMPSMPDQESKEALGRASWKYFHTLLARFPDEPSEDERSKLSMFINLYAELYPCGECSKHFQKMIKKYPVQTSSRTSAALWGCHIHNLVNKHLEKPDYDCSTILEDYDCGCGDDNIKLNKVSINKEEKQLG